MTWEKTRDRRARVCSWHQRLHDVVAVMRTLHVQNVHRVSMASAESMCRSAGEEAAVDASEGVTSEDQVTQQSMRAIYEQLSTCFSSEQADEIAINFCFVQTKSVPLIPCVFCLDRFIVQIHADGHAIVHNITPPLTFVAATPFRW